MDVQSDNSQPERPINERLKTSARRVLILSYIAVFFYSPAFLYIGFFAKDHLEYRKAGIICCVAYCCSALLANTCIYILARQAFYNVSDGTDNRSAYMAGVVGTVFDVRQPKKLMYIALVHHHYLGRCIYLVLFAAKDERKN
ncbi:hypothetical protein L596_009894 [Steinernema carpocapsae]|uniref:Uncharacterized protein n=1 Tax=Steinernema carpocapsae TaxID=34508 RepID=A0A4U5PGZ7_STECR|nr:hypothetical protein L596_009894 [Steinernema carpocapsae]